MILKQKKNMLYIEDYMEKHNYITLHKGKIIINQEQMEQLSLRYGDVII